MPVSALHELMDFHQSVMSVIEGLISAIVGDTNSIVSIIRRIFHQYKSLKKGLPSSLLQLRCPQYKGLTSFITK